MRRATLLCAGLAAVAVPRLLRAQTSTLRVGAVPSDGFGEVWYAADMGFFTKAGLGVEITPFSNGGAVAAGILGNAIDVGISGPISLANAMLHGAPLVYIAAGNLYLSARPTIALCVSKESPIRSAKDFEGGTVGVIGLKDPSHLAAITWLAKNGADIGKINIIEAPGSQAEPALKRGALQGAVISEPFFSAALADDARVFGKCYDAIGDGVMIGGWFSTTDWAVKNVTLARRFAAVIYETARWANANHDASGIILKKYTKISDETLHAMTRVTYAERLAPVMIEPQLQLAAKARFTDRLVSGSELIAKL